MQLGKLTLSFGSSTNSPASQPFYPQSHTAGSLSALSPLRKLNGTSLGVTRRVSSSNKDLRRINYEAFVHGYCLAALCAVTLSAQTPSQPPASASQDTMKTVTATGCLRAGDQPNSFVLSNVKWADKAAGAATGTSGTAAPAPAPAGASLKLVGSPAGVQLTEHIGKTVEVTGTLAEKSPSAAAPPAAGEQAAKKDEPTLNVRTAKMVSSSCESK